MKQLIDSIFDINSPAKFNLAAMAVFRFQAQENEIYANFLAGLGIIPQSVSKIEQIPFLPIEFFKTHKVISGKQSKTDFQQIFSSCILEMLHDEH